MKLEKEQFMSSENRVEPGPGKRTRRVRSTHHVPSGTVQVGSWVLILFASRRAGIHVPLAPIKFHAPFVMDAPVDGSKHSPETWIGASVAAATKQIVLKRTMISFLCYKIRCRILWGFQSNCLFEILRSNHTLSIETIQWRKILSQFEEEK